MFTRIKTEAEIQAMRDSGRILATVLKKLHQTVAVGMSGKEISAIAAQELKALGGKPAFLGYHGFPDIICISINDEVVHGIPTTQPFQEGDIISFDFGVTYKGMITDSAFTMLLGDANAEQQRLIKNTERSLYAGIEKLRDGVRVGDVAAAIESVLHEARLGIVEELVGHGVGHNLHEDPNIPNYGRVGTGPTLQAGMTIAIEPMATLGSPAITIDRDGWTIRTADNSLAAHFEHTILITHNSYDILTAW